MMKFVLLCVTVAMLSSARFTNADEKVKTPLSIIPYSRPISVQSTSNTVDEINQVQIVSGKDNQLASESQNKKQEDDDSEECEYDEDDDYNGSSEESSEEDQNGNLNKLKTLLSVLSLYNNVSQRCSESQITPVSCSGPLDEDGLMPHPDDCHLFYQCISPALPPICRECPPNLHFNPVKKVCDYPQSAGCETVQDKNNKIPLRAENNLVQCKETNGVFAELIPHPTMCDRYFACNWGVPTLMYCPEGLHYCSFNRVCDYPERAQCQADIPA